MAVKEGALFTRFEEATAIAALSEAIYVAHVDGAKPYLSPGEAVRAAALIFGLAQSDRIHAVVKGAIANPDWALTDLNAMKASVGNQAGSDKEMRAVKFAQALNAERMVATKGS